MEAYLSTICPRPGRLKVEVRSPIDPIRELLGMACTGGHCAPVQKRGVCGADRRRDGPADGGDSEREK